MKPSELKQAAFIAAPLLALFGAALLFLYSTNARQYREIVATRATNNVRIGDMMLRHELGAVVSDLQYLANAHEAISALEGRLSDCEIYSLILFADTRKVYDQIRYLDITGMEVFRLNFDGTHSSVEPRVRLQFKGNRYYAVEGLKLLGGEVYISPLDLNVERGQVEQPHKPMIRFVTPVLGDKGARLGVVVLNYLGRRLLDVFDKVPGRVDDDRMMLLNQDGYWLRCQDPDNEWGFMFPDRRDRTMEKRYPEAWAAINAQTRGQFENKAGLFTFSTLCLADVIEASTVRNPEHEAGCWKIVSLVPREVFVKADEAYASRLGLIGVPGALFLAALSLIVVHLRSRSRLAEQSIIAQNTSFARFVPTQFLRLLGKGSLREVELSTSVQREVTVLFSDIRSYTTLSESMTSVEVFTLLNDYFVTVSKAITANEGFIDIFIGDALMALFPRNADDALRAAVGMRHDLRELNDTRRKGGLPPVHSGFGLHCGEVTLGTIGTHDRMQTTAIGDSVNLAARIESVTKSFKVEIVISDTVHSRLADPDVFLLREIDTVRVKGKQEAVTLFECFDADPEDLAKGKVATMSLLAEGIVRYKAGDFDAALESFEACARACPGDTIPPIYIKRCHTMKRIPPGDGWTGISTL